MRALLMLLALTAMVTPALADQKPSAATSKTAAAAKPGPTPAAPVNLNTATQAQLETLPGIGAKAAERILEYRKQNGSFKKSRT